VHCFASPEAEVGFFDDMVVGLSFPVGSAEMDAWLGRYQELYRRCERRNGDLLRHVSTADTARDLDLLRRAVGDRRLSYDGLSYGTFLGATYANLFPDRVRALVLDANLNPKADVSPQVKANGGRFLSTDLRQGSDLSAARTLDAFLDPCGSTDAAHCAFTAGSPEATRAKYAALLARLQTDPQGANVTYAQVVSMTGTALYSTAAWPSLATALQDLWTTGNAPAPTASPGQLIGQIFAIRCSESPNPGPAGSCPWTPSPTNAPDRWGRGGRGRACPARAGARPRPIATAAPGTGAPRTQCWCSTPPTTPPPHMKARWPCRDSWPGRAC
jgi:pimeloyl-ACP methyl ester carboxylesterase